MFGSGLRAIGVALVVAFSAAPVAMANPYQDDSAWYVDEYPAGIALFSGPNFTGEVREAFDIFASMHDLAFNDRARSVAVLAGQWELCEHRDFTGRCMFIREDVADLRWYGLAGRISSIRPVFEYTEAEHGLLFIRDHRGYIRYVHDEYWADQYWSHGYARSRTVTIHHYGFGQDYWRHGFYDPHWGFGPYGFAWSPYGHVRYVSRPIRVHPRPVVINHYWRERPRDYWRGHKGARPSHPHRGRDYRRSDDRDYRSPRPRDDRHVDRPRDQRPRNDGWRETRGDDRQGSGRGGQAPDRQRRDWQGQDGQGRDGQGRDRQGRDGRPRGDDNFDRGPRRGEGVVAERPGGNPARGGRGNEANPDRRQWQGRPPGEGQARGSRPGASEIPRDPRGPRREASAGTPPSDLRGGPRQGAPRGQPGDGRGRFEGSRSGNPGGEGARRGGNRDARSGGGERAARPAPPPQPRREASASPPRPQPERQREARRPAPEPRRPDVRREAPPERPPRIERGDNRSRPANSFDPGGDQRRR